jgi:pimeloyl-ACP methyl ester carboxylesterase
MIFAGGWMTHLEKDWESPTMKYFLSHLAKSFRLIRFDQRGNGMSDWDNVEMSFEKMVDDFERVYPGNSNVRINGTRIIRNRSWLGRHQEG